MNSISDQAKIYFMQISQKYVHRPREVHSYLKVTDPNTGEGLPDIKVLWRAQGATVPLQETLTKLDGWTRVSIEPAILGTLEISATLENKSIKSVSYESLPEAKIFIGSFCYEKPYFQVGKKTWVSAYVPSYFPNFRDYSTTWRYQNEAPVTIGFKSNYIDIPYTPTTQPLTDMANVDIKIVGGDGPEQETSTSLPFVPPSDDPIHKVAFEVNGISYAALSDVGLLPGSEYIIKIIALTGSSLKDQEVEVRYPYDYLQLDPEPGVLRKLVSELSWKVLAGKKSSEGCYPLIFSSPDVKGVTCIGTHSLSTPGNIRRIPG
ncbi:hypothetical protein [Pseudomonas mandelii]|uniref:Uncharacterized protein n=1 Tax=Pseudomonas mandelii TaxID=75612 RepID=A0A502IIY8_9PSED|nr:MULTISPECIES: hypothetical protein [Pseudomonas]TPG85418.1 hypothetical protein EAH74_09055 [Pseudomonas mandelii]TPG99135.1 hypothetical protein EAH72_02085 [Pseudomonas caspiana]